MSRSTFYGFEIAKTGLFISQRQLDVTGHNIANLDSPGFSRQRLETAAIPAAISAGLFLSNNRANSGRGVTAVMVGQIRNAFLDQQYRNESSKNSYWSTMEYEFYKIEQLFNSEIGDKLNDSSISSTFQDFYNALYNLQENPSSSSVRLALVTAAEKVVSTIGYNAGRLLEQYNTINDSIKAAVTDINTILEEIGELNQQIRSYELYGGQANDLRDSRNLLLDELAAYIDIDYYETSDGKLVIDYQGNTILNHTDIDRLVVNADKAHAFGGADVYQVYFESDPTFTTALSFQNEWGALSGYFRARDGNTSSTQGIPYIMSKLDEVARKLVMEMNYAHVQGWSLNSDTLPSDWGIQFFEDIGTFAKVPSADCTDPTQTYWSLTSVDGEIEIHTYDTGLSTWTSRTINIYDQDDLNNFCGGVTALNMAVNSDIKANLNLIAAAGSAVTDKKGDNTNVARFTEMISKKNNINEVYKGMITALGIEMKAISSSASNAGIVLEQVDQLRQSIMGVSLDEEITNIIKYNYSYQAASRMITAIDEELDMLINKMGLVGRA